MAPTLVITELIGIGLFPDKRPRFSWSDTINMPARGEEAVNDQGRK
jgi:hypothetical protein